MTPDKSVIFCATQRTGSTLIFDDLLNLVGWKRRNPEILYEWIVRKKTDLPWSEVWNEIRAQNQVHGTFIAKVMFHYTPIVSSYMERNTYEGVRNCYEFRPELFDAFHSFFADAIWVYVDRRDVFSQAVSMYMAESTNVWEKLTHIPKPGVVTIPERPNAVPESEVRYDAKKLKRFVRSFLNEREQWQRFFEHYKIEPIRISYEEAVCHFPHYLNELLSATGLQSVAEPPARRMIKVGTQRNEEWATYLRNDIVAELFSRSLADGQK